MPFPIAGALSLGGSLLSGITGGKGAKKAAQAQARAIEAATAEQRRQFDVSQQNFAPFLGAGQAALGEYANLIGLPGIVGGFGGGTFDSQGNQVTTGGNGSQAAAIERLKQSPGFTSLFDTGRDTILQSAAATGGVRGDNLTDKLGNFGSSLLAQVIQQQLGNLGGLVSVGSGAAGSLGQLGANSANSISDLLVKGGDAQASGILAQSQIQNRTLNDLIGQFNGLGASQGWKGF